MLSFLPGSPVKMYALVGLVFKTYFVLHTFSGILTDRYMFPEACFCLLLHSSQTVTEICYHFALQITDLELFYHKEF